MSQETFETVKDVKDEIKTENTKNKKTIAVIFSSVVIMAVALFAFLFTADGRNYNKAIKLYQYGDYVSACDIFAKLGEYEESLNYLEKCEIYIQVIDFSNEEKYSEAVSFLKENRAVFTDNDEYKSVLDEYKYLLAEQCYKNKSYVNAYDNLTDNSYTGAEELLKEIEPFYNSEKAVDDILETYQWMGDWLDDLISKGSTYYEKQMIINSGAEWDTFYINRGASIVNLLNKLESKDYTDCSYDIKDLIGYVPETKTECVKILKELQDVFITKGGLKNYNGYFLFYVMNYIIDSKYVTVHRDANEGSITISQVDKYLSDKNISAKTFAYMLGIPEMYSMKVQKQADSITFTFSSFSHNYAYCCIGNDEQRNKKIDEIMTKAEDNITVLYSSDGYDYAELDLSGINTCGLDYLRINFVGFESDESVILSQDNHYLDKNELVKSDLKLIVKIKSDSEMFINYWVCDYS